MKTRRCLNGMADCSIKETHRHTPGDPAEITYPGESGREAVLDKALDLACATLFRNGVGKAYAPQQKADFIAQAERELVQAKARPR